MADQLHDIVARMMAAGESEEDIAAVIRSFQPAVSHERSEPQEAKPIASGGRGTGLDVRKSNQWARDNAPVIGATLATTATGGGALPLILAAGGGAAAGSALRGDDAETIATEGVKGAATQGAGMALRPISRMVARGFMKGTVPKNIAKEYQGQVDIPSEMLDRNVVPGIPASARRVSAQSSAANAERDAAASSVPRMNAVKTVEGLRPIYQRAVRGGFPDDAKAILAEAQQSVRNIRQTPGAGRGLPGTGQLARKDVLQGQSTAALRGSEALTPVMKDAQRDAIVSHMRQTPRMANALNESQSLMAIDQVMKDAALGNPVTRMRIGGPAAASLTPAGLGLTAHAIDKGGKALSPDAIRALQIMASLFEERE